MTGHRILVVEDAPDLALAVSMELEEEGFVVTLAHTGGEAFEEIAREVPELAVLDMQLPDTTGIALCEEIRRSHSIPLIIFSGVNSAVSVKEVIQRGATDYVLKGSGLAELIARVKQHLGVGSPVVEASPEKSAGRPLDDEDSDGRPRVLVVESDMTAQAKLIELLTSNNYRAIAATTAAEAVELAAGHRPNIIVVALDSPAIGGLKLVQTLRSSFPKGKAPGMVGVSKRLSPEAVRRAKYHGVAAFISRPWNPSRIHLEVSQSIEAALKAARRAA